MALPFKRLAMVLAAGGGSGTPSVQRNTTVLFGDSITEFNGTGLTGAGSNPDINLSDIGFFTWGNTLLGQRFRVIKNSGIGGNTTTQMVARISTDVLAYAPKYCTVMGGVNDVRLGSAAVDIFANLQSIYTTLINAGIIPIVFTCLPVTSNWTGYANKSVLLSLNTLIRNYCAANSLLMVDSFQAITGDTTSDASAGNIQSDGVHPQTKGAKAVGGAMATLFANLAWTDARVTTGDNITLTPTSKQLLSNPLMQGSGGTASNGTGTCSGTVPTGYTVTWLAGTGICVCSVVARADGFGNDLVLTITGASSNANLAVTSEDLTGRFANSDTIYAEAMTDVSNLANCFACNLKINYNINAGANSFSSLRQGSFDFAGNTPNAVSWVGTERTRVLNVASTGTISAAAWVFTAAFNAASGRATIKLGRAAVMKNS